MAWYDSIESQQAAICDDCYGLIAPCNDLLPFMFLSDMENITEWKIKYLDGILNLPVYHQSIDPSISWNIGVVSGAGSINLYDGDNGLTYGTANWTTDLNTTINILVNSVNSNTSLGSLFIGSFNNSAGFTASWDGSVFTLSSPNGSGATYNAHDVLFAVNMGTWSGDTGSAKTFSGGANSYYTYEDTDTLDITTCIDLLNQITVDGNKYVIYNGDLLKSCMPVNLACGRWYSEISDGSATYYSEIFIVTEIDEQENIYLPHLKSAWAYHTNENLLNKNKGICKSLCTYSLISTSNKLIPFIVKRDSIANPVSSWVLRSIDGDCEINLDTSLITVTDTGAYDYLTYNGDEITNLECGTFISILSDGVNTFYGEPIQVIDMTDNSGSFILMEDGSYILQENNDKILLE